MNAVLNEQQLDFQDNLRGTAPQKPLMQDVKEKLHIDDLE